MPLSLSSPVRVLSIAMIRSLLLAGLLVAVPAGLPAQAPESPLDDTRLTVSTLLREDVFAGFQQNDLARRIEQLLEEKKEKIVIIKADEDVEYGAVMEAMDTLRSAGIEDMGLITETRRSSAAGAQ